MDTSQTETADATSGASEQARAILTPFSRRHALIASTLVAAAAECHGEPGPMIARLRALSPGSLPLPVSSTLQLWELLARVAAVDLTAARALEPHLDAHAILMQANIDPPRGLAWGVFAAEGGSTPVHARASTSNSATDWHLWGTKPWCSLARQLDRALVTAHVDDGRRLFAVDLAQEAVTPLDEEWSSRGLARVVSTPVRFDGARAAPVGTTDWYLGRPGFTWGAVGVAACWLGGAVGLFRDLEHAMSDKEPDQLAFAWLGAARRHVRAGIAVMTHAAGLIDRGELDWSRALEIRGTIVEHCTQVLRICADALGPSALAFDEDHARRVADLGMYVQQHHAGRDDVDIGHAVVRASQRGFSHRDDGTSAAEWRSSGLSSRDPFDLDELVDGNGRIIVVAAHPDDETLGAGGLIARAVRSGRDVRVVLCTDGEASHPHSPTHDPEQLAVRRRAEFVRALSRLGLDGDAADVDPRDENPLTFLGLPDGRLADHTATIAEAVRALATHGCCIAAPLRDDGHTDHEAAGVAAAEVAVDRDAVLVEYPIWYWHWASPAGDSRWRTLRAFHLDDATLAVKRSALDEYVSQSRPLSPDPSDAAVLTERFLEHFTGRIEPFRVTRPGRGGAGDARSTFNTLYRESDDPWRADSAYERRKRAVLLASLPRARYDSALELGCGQGHLTDALAERCATLVAVDASDVAIAAARRRLGDGGDVRFEVALVPREWPRTDEVDLVVMSEMGYFLSERELDDTLTRIERASTPGAHVVLCHWLHEIDGWSLDGTTVHHRARHRDWRSVVTHVDDDFVLDVFEVHPAGPIESQHHA